MNENHIQLIKFTLQDSWRYVKICSNYKTKHSLNHKSKIYHKNTLKINFIKFMTDWDQFFYKVEYQGKFAGFVCILEYYLDPNNNEYDYDKSSLAYALLPNFRSKGIATIAVKKILIEYAKNPEALPLMAVCRGNNPKSAGVLLKNNFLQLKSEDDILLFEKIGL